MIDDIELFLFDLDGTLIEFHHQYLFEQAERIIAELERHPVERQRLEHFFRHFDFFQFVTDAEREAFVNEFWSRFDWNNFPEPIVQPGVHELLEAIRQQGRRAAIVTSRAVPVAQLESELKQTGILEHISFIQTRECDHVHWADKRDSIRTVLARANAEPTRTAMVGDIPPDISSARVLGLRATFALLSGGLERSVLELARPDAIFDDIEHLFKHYFTE